MPPDQRHADASCLPCIEAAETLYSWSAHVHRLWGSVSAAQTSLRLYGHTHVTRQHELACRLERVVGHFCGTLSLGEILRRHTILQAYSPFLPVKTWQAALDQAVVGSPYWARSLLATSRARPVQHPLRLCPRCVEEDGQSLGRATWRTLHQLPGVCCCLQHHEPLHVAQRPPKDWLTADAALGHARPLGEFPKKAGMICASVALAAGQIDRIDPDQLCSAILDRLCGIGVIHSRFRTDTRRLGAWFASTPVGRLCATPELGLQSLSDGAWIGGQLWRQRHGHPARWLMLWSALEWENSQAAATAFTAISQGSSVDADGQVSLPGIAGRSTATPERIKHAIARAASHAEAIRLADCTKADMVRWLDADPPLRLAWKAQRRERRRLAIEAKVSAPRTSPEALPALADSDKRWLKQHEPIIYAQLGAASAKQWPLF